MSFESKYDILNSDENTVTCHLTSICCQMDLTENTSENQRWAKSDTFFKQRPSGNKYDTRNN